MPATSRTPDRVAVVGAGIAGLSAARALAGAGHVVRVFDKARGPAGRTATRRQDGAAFDHGAQYFTVRDEEFRTQVHAWREAGIVDLWRPRLYAGFPGRLLPREETTDRWVGVPRMSALARHLAEGLDVRTGVRVAPARREQDTWRLRGEGGEDLGTWDVLLVTAPPAQTAALLEEVGDLARAAEGVDLAPCWAAMIAFASPVAAPIDAAFVEDSPLAWIARNNSKPGRPPGEAWVLHASPAWSRAHLEESPEEVGAALLESFCEALGTDLPTVVTSAFHRWRYALPPVPLEDVLWDEGRRVGAGGDWCASARVEGAWLAGRRLAARVDPASAPARSGH